LYRGKTITEIAYQYHIGKNMVFFRILGHFMLTELHDVVICNWRYNVSYTSVYVASWKISTKFFPTLQCHIQ